VLQIKEVRVRVKKLLHQRKMKVWKEAFGLVQRGEVGANNDDALLPFQPATMNRFPTSACRSFPHWFI